MVQCINAGDNFYRIGVSNLWFLNCILASTSSENEIQYNI